MGSTAGIEPFSIAIDDEILRDLHRRLDDVRWPNEPVSLPWQYGADLQWMRHVADHWRHQYDWRVWERRLNEFSNYRADVDGIKIHFVLEPGSGPNPLPLILTHGWPGSFVEFLDVIEPLAHPERHGGDVRDAFTVIVPSLPGYGFSEAPDRPIDTQRIAELWSRLMTDILGFPRYVAQGGDWGSAVTSRMGMLFPKNLAAIHLNAAGVFPEEDPDDPFTPEELSWMKATALRRAELGGYALVQGTRPQTLAYGLTDSPVGLAAWILEKFHDWTNRGEDAPPPFDLDHLLTNVMLYWINGINSANWLYVSLMEVNRPKIPPGMKVGVPTGFTLCPSDLGELPPDRWLRRCYNLVYRKNAETGGHFLAFEQNRLFVDEVRGFFSSYR